MARDRDLDSASSGGQSKRPPLNHRDSDSHSDTTNTSGAPSHHHRTKHHQKQHHVGHGARLHARVPSSKAVHKQHGHVHPHGHAHANTSKLNRKPASRPTSPTEFEFDEASQRPSHRRATSEVKLPRQSSASHLPKSSSHSSLKRNRSHVEVGKRTRSSDKLKRTASGTGINKQPGKSSKIQVHFDLGSDDPEDEWVDASGSNSPYLSRKGSLNSSAQSSLRQGTSTENSRPVTPSAPSQLKQTVRPSPDRATSHHKEYLTSRLLQRTPSHGAPPKMTVDIAKAAPTQLSRSISSTDRNITPSTGSNQDELVSRFVDTASSGLASQGSFYHPPNSATSRRSDDTPQRPSSMANIDQAPKNAADAGTLPPAEVDNSALVPKAGRRTAGPAAETSRTQQKLNLQRASSVLEPGQALTGAGGVVGASPLIGVGGPGYDGGNSRDPRIGKLLERTGMEYLVVRRYQNPVARSLNRLSRLPGMEKTRRIPRTPTGAVNGKRLGETNARHTRNVSMPDPRQTTPRSGASVRTNGAGSSFDGDDTAKLNERLSGVSLVGAEEEDGTNTLLRNLWEKSMDLSASTD
ncbi:hypothetical protein VFPPC_13063 [Pochonia chlamydosporia 170]|uniref:Uncharacterized protein n=1 Tax=Pochonia chlamydosporia 170 TaxID=1380566 RepID=A0A179G7D5_METCM|nr:hypothetical protein VFPPC_13063 [Pochonia chlamydosporia 170]OAQ73706.1 hypothetical protein VFPPC_13063 [Pochonia chlamydosporia 170]